MVGGFMLGFISMIDLSDLSETFPVFITLLTMVLTYSIAEGMALGMLAFVFVKLLSGQYRSISLPLYILAVLFILRYAFA